MYLEKCLCGWFTLALAFLATEPKWILKIFAMSTGFVTIEAPGTLIKISFYVINDFISFQVFLILLQLGSKGFDK